MFDYTVTYEEEMAIRIEEAVELATERAMEKGLEQGLEQGLFVSAIKFMQNSYAIVLLFYWKITVAGCGEGAAHGNL